MLTAANVVQLEIWSQVTHLWRLLVKSLLPDFRIMSVLQCSRQGSLL